MDKRCNQYNELLDDALIAAAGANDCKLIEKLINEGADPNARNQSAFIAACRKRNEEAVHLLRAKGANLGQAILFALETQSVPDFLDILRRNKDHALVQTLIRGMDTLTGEPGYTPVRRLHTTYNLDRK